MNPMSHDSSLDLLQEETVKDIAEKLARLAALQPGAVARILGDPRLSRYIPPEAARRALEMERARGTATVH